jgi:hypothetical protein
LILAGFRRAIPFNIYVAARCFRESFKYQLIINPQTGKLKAHLLPGKIKHRVKVGTREKNK